jgi:N-acetylmuramic acid 6-phosphate etherase
VSGERVPSRAHVASEAPNPRTDGLDELSLREALGLIQAEDARLTEALAAAADSIAAAAELVAERLGRGGRLFYVGAGTSGRLGVLDAVECPPTFQSEPGQVQALIAGGEGAMFEAVEGAEDSAQEAADELRARGLGHDDVVLGISASGTTPYVHGALACARACGAASVMLACVPFANVPDDADLSIRVDTGPEVVTGSTRLKAGTATKMVLNAISTLVMVRLGKVHGNCMVDVNTSGNRKLLDRGVRLVSELCGLEREAAASLLEAAGGRVKLAVVMHARGVDPEGAEVLLKDAGGHLRRAISTEAST